MLAPPPLAVRQTVPRLKTPDHYILGWKLLDAVSTPNLESFARCLTPLFRMGTSRTPFDEQTALVSGAPVTLLASGTTSDTSPIAWHNWAPH